MKSSSWSPTEAKVTPAKNATRSKIKEIARELALPPSRAAMSPALTDGKIYERKNKGQKAYRNIETL